MGVRSTKTRVTMYEGSARTQLDSDAFNRGSSGPWFMFTNATCVGS